MNPRNCSSGHDHARPVAYGPIYPELNPPMPPIVLPYTIPPAFSIPHGLAAALGLKGALTSGGQRPLTLRMGRTIDESEGCVDPQLNRHVQRAHVRRRAARGQPEGGQCGSLGRQRGSPARRVRRLPTGPGRRRPHHGPGHLLHQRERMLARLHGRGAYGPALAPCPLPN